jgi:hypothetical protein
MDFPSMMNLGDTMHTQLVKVCKGLLNSAPLTTIEKLGGDSSDGALSLSGGRAFNSATQRHWQDDQGIPIDKVVYIQRS